MGHCAKSKWIYEWIHEPIFNHNGAQCMYQSLNWKKKCYFEKNGHFKRDNSNTC